MSRMGPSGQKLFEIIVWEKNLSLKKKKRANARSVSCRFVDNPAATEEWMNGFKFILRVHRKREKKIRKNSKKIHGQIRNRD